MALSLVPVTAERFAETSAICALQFGAQSYQASPNYLRWLYEENPRCLGRGILGYEDQTLFAVSHEIAAWSAFAVTACSLS